LKREAPFDVPPGGAEPVDGTVHANSPGPFNCLVHVYFDDGGLREEVLTVRGTAAAKGDAK
jgi:hypothetical protein